MLLVEVDQFAAHFRLEDAWHDHHWSLCLGNVRLAERRQRVDQLQQPRDVRGRIVERDRRQRAQPWIEHDRVRNELPQAGVWIKLRGTVFRWQLAVEVPEET